MQCMVCVCGGWMCEQVISSRSLFNPTSHPIHPRLRFTPYHLVMAALSSVSVGMHLYQQQEQQHREGGLRQA